MRRNRQKNSSKKSGDCFRASLTSMLDIPNLDSLPNVHESRWFINWLNWLENLGLSIRYEAKSCWGRGYWIASVQSKNYKNTSHAIVMYGSEVAHDPSTKKRYRKGTSMLGKGLVQGGYVIDVIDASKLHNLCEFRKNNPKD